MVDSLLSDQATDAVNLLRSKFIGFLGNVSIKDNKERKLADFLTAEGVLLKPDIDGSCYHMASAFIDLFIQKFVISKKYPNAPSTPIPKQYEGGPLNILEVLKESLKFFDKGLIERAADRSYKRANNILVPRESVYNGELFRILKIWLFNLGNYKVTGQWHLRKHVKYSDIVIDKLNNPNVVLELLASENPDFVQNHIDRTPEYMNLLSATEAWESHSLSVLAVTYNYQCFFNEKFSNNPNLTVVVSHILYNYIKIIVPVYHHMVFMKSSLKKIATRFLEMKPGLSKPSKCNSDQRDEHSFKRHKGGGDQRPINEELTQFMYQMGYKIHSHQETDLPTIFVDDFAIADGIDGN
ncbi:hypothetical protein BC937DRAFT_87685 [Endogone sp. FLAS-F59071]|nr:hypothetical protein BC937DRAFT_87685 [Endogone sp. FLAS-F59071]|eukprot:RUS22703.1 hypothetical protein BC937DRAFT_87685 [Endogone sp. FLAS-F59071]